MTDFKPEISNVNFPRGFRPVRFNFNNFSNNENYDQYKPSEINEVIYDEPISNYEKKIDTQNQNPPYLPASSPPHFSSLSEKNRTNSFIDLNRKNLNQNFSDQARIENVWQLPVEEQEQVEHHLRQHLSRTPTPIPFDKNSLETVEKVITDKQPPGNAEYLFENDSYKFYTVPSSIEKTKTIKSNINSNKQKVQGIGPTTETGMPLTLRTGVNQRHGSDWYKSMFKNLHKMEKPKWMQEKPIKSKTQKTRKSKKEPVLEYEMEDDKKYMNQYSSYQELDKKKKEMQKIAQQECSYIYDEPENNYVLKKKKSSKSQSPVSRKTYAMVQKGEDIPLFGLRKPAPKSKLKVEFLDQKNLENRNYSRTPSPVNEMRSPTPVSLTYPATDYVPERPPTPQYITQQSFHYNAQTKNSYNQVYSNENKNYDNLNQKNYNSLPVNKKSYKKKINDFNQIDDWQRKINEDFNQLYTNIERTHEVRILREKGKLISPLPFSKEVKNSNLKTAKDLYLDQNTSPLPSKNNLEKNEIIYDNYTTIKSQKNKKFTDLSSKMNKYHSNQSLNQMSSNIKEENEYVRHKNNCYSSLNNLNYCDESKNFNFKIFAQPTTTRTYTESNYYDHSTNKVPSFNYESNQKNSITKQPSIHDIEKQLNDQIDELFRSTSSFSNKKEENYFYKKDNFDKKNNFLSSSLNTKPEIAMNNTFKNNFDKQPPSPPPKQTNNINRELFIEKSNENFTNNSQNCHNNFMNDSQNFYENYQTNYDDNKIEQFKLNLNQDVNNVNFQNEEEPDLEKLIKKIEQDAILQDELGLQ